MQCPYQQPEGIVTTVAAGVLSEAGYGATDAVVGEDHLESLERADPLHKGDFDDRLDALRRVEFVDGRRNRRGFADGAEIGPGARDIAVRQEKAADFPRGVDESLVVFAPCFGGHGRRIVGLDQRQPELMTLLEQPHFEEEWIVLVVEDFLRQEVESGVRPAGAERLIDVIECVVSHGRPDQMIARAS